MAKPSIGIWREVKFTKKNYIRTYENPHDLWKDAQRYFQWCEDNPLYEERLVPRRTGRPYRETVEKPRAMTVQGLCSFLGISVQVWYHWRKQGLFMVVVETIENAIYAQKFEYAAVDLMNAGIIARELKLADRNELTGADGGPLQTTSTEIDLSQLTEEELNAYRLLSAAAERNRSRDK